MRFGGIYEPYDPPPPNSPFAFRKWNTIADMTAIAVVCLPDGFVIGADGLRKSFSGETVTEEGQKVFCFRNDKIVLAYAWCGQTVIWGENNREPVFFDFRSTTESCLLTASSSNDLTSFANDFCSLLQSALVIDKFPNKWADDSFEGSVARMLIAGYFDTELFMAEVTVTRGKGSTLDVSARRITPGQQRLRVFSGCPHVSPDEDLTKKPENSQDAKNLICTYIRRCVENPKCNGRIGGKSHVAFVTPDSFTWIEPPAGVAV